MGSESFCVRVAVWCVEKFCVRKKQNLLRAGFLVCVTGFCEGYKREMCSVVRGVVDVVWLV